MYLSSVRQVHANVFLSLTVELREVEKFTLIPLVKVVIFNVLVELNGPFNSFDEQQFSPFRVNFNPFSVNF